MLHSADVVGDNHGRTSGCKNYEQDKYNEGYAAGAASVTPEDGVTQADVDAAAAAALKTDLKSKLCRHGELSSSIRTWVQIEAKARAEGAEPFKRPSTCNCIVTHGLQNHTRTRLPSPPPCMYDVLASNEAKELDVGEVGPALQLPGRSVYLAPSGTFFCQHKTRLVPITKAARPYIFKAERGKCHCSLALPRRAAKLPLGRCIVSERG